MLANPINTFKYSMCSALAPNGGSCFYFDQNNKHIMMYNSEFINTTSTESDGGALVFYYNIAHVKVFNCSFNGSFAAASGGAILVALNTRDITFEYVTVSNSRSNNGGGCIALSSNTTFMGRHLHLSNCEVLEVSGGAMSCGEMEFFELHDSVIENNFARGNGGGIEFSFGANSILINNARISSNTASNGGGLNFETSTNNVHIVNSRIVNNKAVLDGGGILLFENNNNIIVAGTVIEGNSATFGGGIYMVQQNYQVAFIMSLEDIKLPKVLIPIQLSTLLMVYLKLFTRTRL